MTSRYALRRDANEPALIAALEARGYTVDRLDPPAPDLVVTRDSTTRLVEVKAPKGGKPRGAVQAASLARQAAWRARHQVITARTADDVDAAWGGLTRPTQGPRVDPDE